jgi:type IV secretory pathway VirB4 component
MDELREILSVEFFNTLVVSVVLVLVALKFVVTAFEWFAEKFGIEIRFFRKKKEEHELLVSTAEALDKLKKEHESSVNQSIQHDKQLQEDLSAAVKSIKDSIVETQEHIQKFADDRVHDREQSFKIQKELTDSIKAITAGQEDRDKQIEALMCGSKELLGAIIDDKYSRYIALKGIPEDEVDEFDDYYSAYKGLLGNHKRDTKYDYVKNHLPVLPVEVNLVTNKKSKETNKTDK